MPDNINHPGHYNAGEIEVIDYIKDKLEAYKEYMTPYQGYCWGNIVKYLSRYTLKGGVEDLKKARWYLNYMIEDMEVGHR